jgi:hypothetical protein
MKVIRLIGRVIIALLMIPAVIQLGLSILGFVAVFRGTAAPGVTSGFMLGKIFGSLVIFMILKWIFNSLSNDRE